MRNRDNGTVSAFVKSILVYEARPAKNPIYYNIPVGVWGSWLRFNRIQTRRNISDCYTNNGLGHLVGNVCTIKQDSYWYTGITVPQIQASIDQDLTVIYDPAPVREEKVKNSNGGNGPTTVITKKYVLDYTSPLINVITRVQREWFSRSENSLNSVSTEREICLLLFTGKEPTVFAIFRGVDTSSGVIMESETGGFTYRYVYGLEKLSVAISPVTTGGGGLIQNGQVKLWYHHDRLGSVDYLNDNVSGKIASYIDYDEWGAPLKKSVLKLGQRELQDVAVEYTVHPYDMVLGVYFAQARMYDAANRRFLSADPVKGAVAVPTTLVQYVYVLDNPLRCGLRRNKQYETNNNCINTTLCVHI